MDTGGSVNDGAAITVSQCPRLAGSLAAAVRGESLILACLVKARATALNGRTANVHEPAEAQFNGHPSNQTRQHCVDAHQGRFVAGRRIGVASTVDNDICASKVLAQSDKSLSVTVERRVH